MDRIDACPTVDADDRAAILASIRAAESADGVRPVSDQTLVRLKHPESTDAVTHLIGRDGGTVVAYAQLAPAGAGAVEAELFVAPDSRGRGYGRELLAALLEAAGSSTLRVWAHGRLAAAEAFARSLHLSVDRELLRMVRALSADDDLAEPRWPEGVTTRTFQVGRDEPAWLAVNARAFADLPDQGGWGLDDLQQREAEEWFDPSGFFLAERSGDLLGFHWTKVHAAKRVGEVYVIGVDPAAQGLGLGKSLLLLGLRHLRDLGLPEVMLYVDGSNSGAIALYEKDGFAVRDVDVRYAASAPDRGAY